MKEKNDKTNVLAECQKELLFNSRYTLDLSMPQQYCSDYEAFPKKLKHLCKQTGKTMYIIVPDKICYQDVIETSKETLEYMFNEMCKDCEYYDFLV